MKRTVRLLSWLLALCLVVGLASVAALAEGADGEKAIQLGTTAIADPKKETSETEYTPEGEAATYYTPRSYVYFGSNSSTPIKWRVLDNDKNNADSDGMFLLSEYLLASGIPFEAAWNSDDGDGQTNPNEWQNSDAQKWCSEKLDDYFTGAEQGGMLGVSKTDAAVDGLYMLRWEESKLSNEKLFFLSVRELADYVGNADGVSGLIAKDGENGSPGVWWLRSPSAYYYSYSGVVYGDGVVSRDYVDDDWAARPAFNINLDSVLFTSAAVGGKISAAPGGGSGGEAAGSISKIATTTTNEWKFTLKDDTRNSFTANLSGSSTVTPGESITVAYSDATTGPNEYVSAILTDASGKALYYGRLVNTNDPAAVTNPANGTVSMEIPADLAAGSYILKVFSEQYNGDYQTDYASDFVNIPLTISMPSVAALPQTGDDSHVVLWLVLMGASCMSAVALAVYGKKKKFN